MLVVNVEKRMSSKQLICLTENCELGQEIEDFNQNVKQKFNQKELFFKLKSYLKF